MYAVPLSLSSHPTLELALRNSSMYLVRCGGALDLVRVSMTVSLVRLLNADTMSFPRSVALPEFLTHLSAIERQAAWQSMAFHPGRDPYCSSWKTGRRWTCFAMTLSAIFPTALAKTIGHHPLVVVCPCRVSRPSPYLSLCRGVLYAICWWRCHLEWLVLAPCP